MSAGFIGSSPGYPLDTAMRQPNSIPVSSRPPVIVKMHVVNLAETGLQQVCKRLYGVKIAIMGLAYKKSINDPQESPAIKIIEKFANLGANVRVYDPLTSLVRVKAGVFISAGILSIIKSKLV